MGLDAGRGGTGNRRKGCEGAQLSNKLGKISLEA